MTARRQQPSAAYLTIRQAIVEGSYAPGQRLIEQRIAESLELSRTPVREALHRLEAEGLVLSEPNRGAVVRALSIADIDDIYGLRARLESYAAELAATRRSDAELLELDAAVADFATAMRLPRAEIDGVRAVHDANRRFHAAILTAAKHDRLTQTLDRTIDVPLVFLAFRQFDQDEVARSYVFHTCIRDAIAGGDGVRAGRLMSEHVLQGRDSLVAHVRAQPGFTLTAQQGTASTEDPAGTTGTAGTTSAGR